jgi:hypothetical protein
MAGHVYVSYDGQDVGYVRRLVDQLAGSWLTVWVDQEAGAGERWYPDLEAPIRAASVVLVIMSPASQNSDRVRGEITYAHRIGRPIIPLLLAGRAFFSQSGNAPENVIGGRLPDDDLIDRLGQLSQTPITHRRSGKPGRGSASRERDAVTSTGTALLAPLRSPSGPSSPHGPSIPSFPRPYETFEDDDEPRRFRPGVLVAAAVVVMLVVGVFSVVMFSRSGSPDRPTTPVGASNPRTLTSGPAPTGSVAATPGPTLTPSVRTSTSKKPTTTAATTTTTITTTSQTPQIPSLSLAISPASVGVSTSATGTVTLAGTYPSDLTVNLVSSDTGVAGVPGSIMVPANATTATFTVTAGATAGSATVTASVTGHSDNASITVTAAP